MQHILRLALFACMCLLYRVVLFVVVVVCMIVLVASASCLQAVWHVRLLYAVLLTISGSGVGA